MKSLNVIKWLVNLADGKPLVFSVAIMLIAIVTMGTVIVNRDRKIDKCDGEKRIIISNYEHRMDSINIANETEINRLNQELKNTLLSIIADSKEAVKEQKELNEKISKSINKTASLIRINRSKIKNLKK